MSSETQYTQGLAGGQTAAPRGRGRLTPRGEDAKPAEVAPRKEAAEEESMTVYPIARAMYRVETETGDYVVDLDGYTAEQGFRAVCLCQDYMYRCAEADIDCKHIIRVKQLVRDGWLPPIDERPEPWMEDRLEALKDEVGDAIESTFSSILESEYKEAATEIDAIEDPLEWDVKQMTMMVRRTLDGEDGMGTENSSVV